MKNLPYWNHNTAYYPWIARRIDPCASVLDVGCGDGTLLGFLDNGARHITGIDTDEMCIARAARDYGGENVTFQVGDFAQWQTEERYGAVVFVASLHHMDMTAALRRAKELLAPDGVLLIVGLAKPSSAGDWCAEVLRVPLSKVLSAAHRMRSTEENNVPVSYRFPTMAEVRQAVQTELPAARLRLGVHYRYLIEWRKEG